MALTYIIHETIPGDDPRLDPRMEHVGEFWHYTVIKFPSGSDVIHQWLHGAEISEDVAKAYKFTSAHQNEISVRKSTSIYDEIADGSGDTEGSDGAKIYYRLNANDIKNTLDFFKTVMKLHLKNHADANSANVQTLNRMIDQVDSVTNAQMLMYDYFDVGFPCCQTKARAPKFNIIWK